MRFMLIVKASKDTEAGVMPSEQELVEMGRFNDEMVQAGIMLDGDGLHPTSKGARVTFKDRKPTVVDGPFTEAKELIAGYWIIQAKSRDEAVAWARRVPFVDGEVEVRQVFELEDFNASDEAMEMHLKHREMLKPK